MDTKSPHFGGQVEDGIRPPHPTEPRRATSSNAEKPMMDDLWKLVQRCWDGNKLLRPSAEQLHASLTDMKFTGLKASKLDKGDMGRSDT